MKSYFVRFIGILFFIITMQSFAQVSFPDSWEGNYGGELHIYGVDSVKMKLSMKLAIFKKTDSIYQWKMTYLFNGKEDVRAYELVIKDSEKGLYVIDEKNTILINGYYKSEIFTSFFSVGNSFIISTYTKTDDDLIFEIIAGNNDNVEISGNQNHNGEAIPEVKSYLVNGRQKAVLYKIELPN